MQMNKNEKGEQQILNNTLSNSQMKNKKIRILHVAQAAGGVEHYIKLLINFMDKDKFENILVCSYDYREIDQIDSLLALEQIKMQRSIGLSDIMTVLKVRKLIKKYHADIVYGHSSKAGAIVRIANIGIKNSCVYNPHGWAFNMRCSKKKKIIYILIERLEAFFCKKIICISEAEKKSAMNMKICSDKKLKVIYNGIDIENYKENIHKKIKREDLGISNRDFVIGMVGRVCEQKAPDIFIKAAKLIKKTIPNSFFIIVGNGEMEETIKRYAEEAGIKDSLYITGWVNNPTDFIELFDIATLLSRWEGFGLVLPEYMMVGKPIIASNVDAIPNIIKDHENGILTEVDNIAGVYRAVIELYENNQLREKLIAAGLEDVSRRFNARRVAEEHGQLFLELTH